MRTWQYGRCWCCESAWQSSSWGGGGGGKESCAVLLPSSIRDVLSAQGTGLLQMHNNEVVLHALYDLSQTAHNLLVHTTTPVPLALHTQLTGFRENIDDTVLSIIEILSFGLSL